MIPNLLFCGDNCVRHLIIVAEKTGYSSINTVSRHRVFLYQTEICHQGMVFNIMNTGEIVSDYFAWSDAYEKYYHNDIF